MWLGSYHSNSIKIQSFLFPRIQNQPNLTQFVSLTFNSNSVPNFEKLQWGNLFLISIPTRLHFIWNFLSSTWLLLTGSNSNPFEKYLKNKKGTVADGSAHPQQLGLLLAPCDGRIAARGRASTLLPSATRRWLPLALGHPRAPPRPGLLNYKKLPGITPLPFSPQWRASAASPALTKHQITAHHHSSPHQQHYIHKSPQSWVNFQFSPTRWIVHHAADAINSSPPVSPLSVLLSLKKLWDIVDPLGLSPPRASDRCHRSMRCHPPYRPGRRGQPSWDLPHPHIFWPQAAPGPRDAIRPPRRPPRRLLHRSLSSSAAPSQTRYRVIEPPLG
jgi:hypothetical protein